jgi:hypothetical protein
MSRDVGDAVIIRSSTIGKGPSRERTDRFSGLIVGLQPRAVNVLSISYKVTMDDAQLNETWIADGMLTRGLYLIVIPPLNPS